MYHTILFPALQGGGLLSRFFYKSETIPLLLFPWSVDIIMNITKNKEDDYVYSGIL